MERLRQFPACIGRTLQRSRAILVACALLCPLLASEPLSAAGPKTFPSAAEAAAALFEAAERDDGQAAILSLLGSDAANWVSSGDAVEDRAARKRFVEAYRQKHAIDLKSPDRALLIVGRDDFPFPFPLTKSARGWSFSPELGKEELLNRRIGRNELEAIQVLLAIVDAQREYASTVRDGSGVLQYARRFGSTSGKRDGLYWPAKEGEAESPLGPLMADAAREGYRAQATGPSGPVPYKGMSIVF